MVFMDKTLVELSSAPIGHFSIKFVDGGQPLILDGRNQGETGSTLSQTDNVDRWIHYAYKSWFNDDHIEKIPLRTSIKKLVDRMKQSLESMEYDAAQSAINDIVRLSSALPNFSENRQVYFECAIGAYRLGNIKQSLSLIFEINSLFQGNELAHFIVQSVNGFLLWQLPDRHIDSIAAWENSLSSLEKFVETNNADAQLKSWLQICRKEISDAFQIIINQNIIPPPPEDFGQFAISPQTVSLEESETNVNEPRLTETSEHEFVDLNEPMLAENSEYEFANLIEKSKLINIVTDQTNTPDKLNYERYASAFAELVCNSDMSTPITIGIYGQWGKGKSFLMRKIKKAIEDTVKERKEKKQKGVDIHIIEFNAWSYSGSEHLWAGLVTKLYDEVEKFMGFQVNWHRFTSAVKRSWKRTLGVILFYVVLGLIAILLTFLLNSTKLEETWNGLWLAINAVGASIIGGSFLASLPILWSSLRDFSDTLFLSRTKVLQKIAAKPDFRDQIGVMADIKKEIGFISSVLKKKSDPKRVVLFIDDLDRCNHKKAVEVLQAIMLLLADEDSSPFVIFLGMDARVIVHAIEENYGAVLVKAGINGYEYLDKIVQVPFVIPPATRTEIGEYVESLLWASDDEKKWWLVNSQR